MSDANDAGRIGSRLALVTVSMMLIMSFFSMISGIFFFSEDLSFMRASMAVDETISEKKYFSFINSQELWPFFNYVSCIFHLQCRANQQVMNKLNSKKKLTSF